MKPLLRTASLLAALAAPAFAQFTNGSFSSGLNNWTVSGDVAVLNGTAVLGTAAFAADDDGLGAGFFNFSGNEPAADDDLETFLGLAPDALSPDSGGGVFAYEGSALYQTISVQAGQVLSFDWTFLTQEAAGADYAFVVIDGAPFNLVDGVSLLAGSTYDFAFTTGPRSFQSIPFVADVTVTFGFGVVDVGNFGGSSALVLNNVSVIPEPSAFAALAGLGALGLAATRRRRRA